MNNTPLKKIDHAAAWTAKELMEQTDKWVYKLTDENLTELDTAFRQIKSNGLVAPFFGKDDFPIPKLAAKIEEFREQLESGLGILNLVGFPIEKYSKDETSVIFWGIGSYIGAGWPQNKTGHLISDIRDTGAEVTDPHIRGYQTNCEMDLHTDGADILGLVCLRKGKEGGENQIVSAISAFNRLVEINPDAAEHLLNTTFYQDWRGEEGPGEKPYYKVKIYTDTPKGMTSLAVTAYILSAQRFEEVPRLTEQDLNALAAYDEAKWEESLVVRVLQEPGNFLFLNNHYLIHARSTFVDYEKPSEKRHLRRLWLESEAWAEARPPAMKTLLDNVWNTGVGIEMWDDEDAAQLNRQHI